MERIALDMDEVMADTLGHQLNWLKKNYGCTLSKADLTGQRPHDQVAPQHIEALEAYMHSGDFFADIPLMPGCKSVVEKLCAQHEVFITTAAMDFPKSCYAKFEWLQRHFSCLPRSRYVFCGDKSIIHADYLIDDSARHFEHFRGTGLLFESPSNLQENRYERMRSWADVAKKFNLG
jgi:5'-nucleotidase